MYFLQLVKDSIEFVQLGYSSIAAALTSLQIAQLYKSLRSLFAR